MPEFMMTMKGPSVSDDWLTYINRLNESGMFRGGSALGNGQCLSKNNDGQSCSVTGFMRFEAGSINQVKQLIIGNPDYESGGEIELLELIAE